jgi:hypothetical protein
MLPLLYGRGRVIKRRGYVSVRAMKSRLPVEHVGRDESEERCGPRSRYARGWLRFGVSEVIHVYVANQRREIDKRARTVVPHAPMGHRRSIVGHWR